MEAAPASAAEAEGVAKRQTTPASAAEAEGVAKRQTTPASAAEAEEVAEEEGVWLSVVVPQVGLLVVSFGGKALVLLFGFSLSMSVFRSSSTASGSPLSLELLLQHTHEISSHIPGNGAGQSLVRQLLGNH